MTSIVSNVLSSDFFLIVIFPVSASTLSLKFRTMFESTATSVALLEGIDYDNVGLVTSAVVKLRAVVELIPA